MALPENLFEFFRAAEIEPSELSQIALSHFGSATDGGPTEVNFGGDGIGSYAIRLVYHNKEKQRLIKVVAGSTLNEESAAAFRAKIDLELQEPNKAEIGTAVLFAYLPVNGWFRYRDIFQIQPVPPSAPRGHSLFGGHPLLVQFQVRPSQTPFLGGYRRTAELRRIQLLLNCLLEVSVFMPEASRHHSWVLDVGPSGITSQYRQTGYHLPDRFSADAFAPVESIPSLARVDTQDYYARTVVINDPDRSLEIPESLELLLDRFFLAPLEVQSRFLRGCFWFDHAKNAAVYSDSAAFTALISSIECLIPQDKSVGKCLVCDRPTGRGSMASEACRFLRRIPLRQINEIPRGPYKALLRIQVPSVTWRRAFVRRPYTLLSCPDPEGIEEQKLSREVWGLVKVVLLNWLYSRVGLLVAPARIGRQRP